MKRAFLFQITENITNEYIKTVVGSSYFGENLQVFFYRDNLVYPTTFLWSNLKPKYTIAILYAEKKSLSDHRHGIEVIDHEKCFIFKSEIEILFIEANKLLKDADLKSKSGRLECFGCGLITDNIYRCGSCSLAKYCSRVD